MAQILITGGTGLVGTHLAELLTQKGHKVVLVSRTTSKSKYPIYKWNPDEGLFPVEALEATDVIIHLAGAGIADHRWTKDYKEIIYRSRIDSANLIFETLKATKNSVRTFISASAVGYYGNTGNVWLDEQQPPSNDFMGKVCKDWEKSATQFESLNIRVIKMRTGVVLSQDGGALPVLSKSVQLFAGAPIGNGLQYIPWIHIDDLCKMYLSVIENEAMHGPFNANAPSPIDNSFFMTLLGRISKKPIWPINIPAFILKLILGEKSVVVINGQRPSVEKIKSFGFKFSYTNPEVALRNLLLKEKNL